MKATSERYGKQNVALPRDTFDYLEQLRLTGLYGASIGEIMRFLIIKGVQDAMVAGFIGRPLTRP